MKGKKILFLIPTLDIGGGERVISELSLNLPSNIQRVIVLLENKVSYPYKGKLISLGVPFSKNFFLKIYYFFVALLRFKRVVKKEKPDLVMSSGRVSHIINILTGRKPVVRCDNFLPEGCKDFWGRLFKILVRFLYNRKSVRIIVVSKGIEDYFIKNLRIKKEKIKLIYDAVDFEKIQRLTKEPLSPYFQSIFKHPVIINIGRLSEQKGQWHLIRAFKEFKKIKKDLNPIKDYKSGEEKKEEKISNGVKLVILGKGELESYLKILIKDLGLENDVYLLGWQENPFKFLARSKLFVSSSLWEGFGLAILEALVCRLPVISSDCKAGPREILAPDTSIEYQTKDIEYTKFGILVPVCERKFYRANDSLTENEKILSRAMNEIISNKELSDNLIKKSIQRIEDFNIRKIIKEYEFLWT